MKISIVSPSFNQAAFIQQTIHSVADQTHPDKEHIIVDGGSTDGCAELVTAFAQEYPHIRSLIEPDRGQADAINKGFHLATGDILAWLNTDDYYSDPEVLAVVADFFDQNPDVDVAWGRGLRVDGDGSVISEAWVQPPGTDFTLALQTSLGLLQPSVFLRRSIFEEVGGLSEEWPLQLDYEYWIRIATAGFRFGFFDRILSHAVVHADAKSTAQRMQQLNECLRLVREKFDYVPIEWIRQFGEFLLTGRDHKVSKGIILNEAQQDDYIAIEARLLEELNGDEQTRVFLRDRAQIEPYSNTYLAMRRHRLATGPRRRIVVTSFDSAYFQQGLNLIAALHRTSLKSFDELFVYSLDLSEMERHRLASLEKVRVLDYPSELSELFPEYLDPKTRAYKPYAIRGEDLDLHNGDLVLWMDAGLAPLQDVDAIFSIVEKQEFFITNHDDKRGWPFYNINFAHHMSHGLLHLDNEDLLGPHLCSALVGYKWGGKYQHIIDDAYRLGKIREAVVWPKVPTEKYKPVLTAEQEALRQRLVSGEAAADSVSRDELLSIFSYWGHRTQVIYSVLTRRAGAPVFSGHTYRRSNDESTRAAAVNWSDTAFDTDRASSSVNLDGIDAATAVYHHRGIYNNLDGLRHKREGDALFVVGNGPSLREFPFELLRSRAWLGMNAAYRYWEQVGIYPTYYSCFDDVVLDSHGVEVVKMIANREQLEIEKFFLRRGILERYPELRDDPAVYFLEDLQRDFSWFGEDRITTGSFSVLVGWLLGYRDLYILGVDLNYVERLSESVEEGRELKIVSDPDSNPNYFFDDYQRKGDRFNPPNRHPGLHLRSWAQIRDITEGFPIRITNLNADSAVRDFPFEDHQAAIGRLDSQDREAERIAEGVLQTSREKRYWRKALLKQLAEVSTEHTDSTEDGETKAGEISNGEPGHEESSMTGIQNVLPRFIRWYISPSGLLFLAALLLAVSALTVSSLSRWLALAALILIGVFMPYRLNREQVRTDARLEAVETRLKKQNKSLAQELHENNAALKGIQDLSDPINRDLTTLREHIRSLQVDVEALSENVIRTESRLQATSESHEDRHVDPTED